MEKKKLVVLTGPTAVGKTKLSIELAKRIGGEIISADSMQVYKHMDIGSAKIRPEEMEEIPHFLVDELEPSEEFNVVVFQQKAKQYMEEIKIYMRGHNLFDIFYGKYREREMELLNKYIELAPREDFADILDAMEQFVYFESKK